MDASSKVASAAPLQTVLLDISSPAFILLTIALTVAFRLYASFLLPRILKALFTNAADVAAHAALRADIRAKKLELLPLQGPTHFAEYALLRRKITALEKQADAMAPLINYEARAAQSPLASFLSKGLPLVVTLVCAYLASGAPLFSLVNTSPAGAEYGCFSSLGGVLALSTPLDARAAAFSEALVFCSPMRFFTIGAMGLMLWTFVLLRAEAFLKNTWAGLAEW